MENIGLLLTFVEERTTLAGRYNSNFARFWNLVFDTVIHRNVRLAEAPSAGEPVVTYASQSKGAVDYRALAAEVLQTTPPVAEPAEERMRRGIQKQLTEIFQGVWIPKRQQPSKPSMPIHPHSIEST